MSDLIKAIIGFLVLATAFVSGYALLQPEEQSGPQGVGIVLTNGNNIDNLIADFAIQKDVCMDPRATTSDCQRGDVITYQGTQVKVFVIAPASLITPTITTKLAQVPLSGSIFYKERPLDAGQRLINLMIASGIVKYQMIYEQ